MTDVWWSPTVAEVWAEQHAEQERAKEKTAMEFLVEFDVQVPTGTPEFEVSVREQAESAAAGKLADEGHLVRLWKQPNGTAVGLYRAESEAELDVLLADLPLADWLRVTVTPLESHPNDPPGEVSR